MANLLPCGHDRFVCEFGPGLIFTGQLPAVGDCAPCQGENHGLGDDEGKKLTHPEPWRFCPRCGRVKVASMGTRKQVGQLQPDCRHNVTRGTSGETVNQ